MARQESLLSAVEVAELLGCSRKTVYRLVHRGELPPPIHVGVLARWSVDDVEALKDRPRKLGRPRRRS